MAHTPYVMPPSPTATTTAHDVVIIGGGIVGTSTAYLLGRAGVRSLLVERDAIGSHASGFAYGGLSPLSGEGIPGPLAAVAREGMRLHQVFARDLELETGINVEYRQRPSISLAFTEDEVRRAQAAIHWQQQQPGYAVRWLDARETRSLEPRIAETILGSVLIEQGADVEPYRLVLALTRAAENRGAQIRHGRVIGLTRRDRRVTSVVLEHDEIPCHTVVLALGPWSEATSAWLQWPIPVRPLKGQILRLRAPGPPLGYSVGWAKHYATTKTDELLWTGTTEEDAGFDETPTIDARDRIITSLLKMLPSMNEATLAQHTACLRPVTADGMLLLGQVPGWDGVYMATGAGRKGILLGPAMARLVTDLITQGNTALLPLDAFDPGRFAGTSPAGAEGDR